MILLNPNLEIPSSLDEGVVYERHYTLNWLVNYMEQEWEEVRNRYIKVAIHTFMLFYQRRKIRVRTDAVDYFC
ncbi:DUF4272 domain-containing protein [Peribacillus butanolivorans]|uniref:DUF4272 domain-containing protein n=1 Tax=Peribacillus butanolivorans TaxID=421767 RepID=UPI0030C98553